MDAMLTLEEAQARLLKLVPALGIEEIPTHTASKRYLASGITAKRTQPAADLSAMDGYAISGDGPWRLVGESRAGSPFAGLIKDGECIRISTGAHMPEGASRVLIQENAERAQNIVRSLDGKQLPEPGQHIRKAGFDFTKGTSLIDAGTLIGPAHIALALSAGHASISAVKRPKVAVLDSGDELVRLPADLAAHQIPASNGPMVQAMIAPLIGESRSIGPVSDDLDALASALAETDDCDILITSGGASVGDHDLVQEALRNSGAEIEFWRVAIKPGKPLMIATRAIGERRQVIVGLPGNPVSSFVTCHLFVLPLIRAALGDKSPIQRPDTLISAVDLPATGNRREFVRARAEAGIATPTTSQDSSALLALANANCLIDRPAGSTSVRQGEPVPAFWL